MKDQSQSRREMLKFLGAAPLIAGAAAQAPLQGAAANAAAQGQQGRGGAVALAGPLSPGLHVSDALIAYKLAAR